MNPDTSYPTYPSNAKRNPAKAVKRRPGLYKLKGCPNPNAIKNSLFKERYNLI